MEIHIGKLVALAASALARGMMDYGAAGRMTIATKVRVADLFADLVDLRRTMIPHFDFDALAHEHGRLALAEACAPANEAERRILDELINSTMEILHKVALSELN